MQKSRNVFHRVVWVAVLGAASLASAKAPDWVTALLARDVSDFARDYTWIRLARTVSLQYTTEHHLRRTYRGAIRVMSESGRAFAEVAQHYNADTERITGAKAWIVSADGRHAESFGVTDFLDEATQESGVFWPQDRLLSFSATRSIEVKGVLVWQIDVESQVGMNDFIWTLPDDVPVLASSLDVAPAPGGKLIWRASEGMPTPSARGSDGALHWEENDHRPPRGGNTPADFIPASRMVALRAIGANGIDDERTWADIARLAAGIVTPQIASGSPELQAKAVTLVAGKKTRWDRIRAISEFVQKEVTYLNVTLDRDCFAGYRPHPAGEVLRNRYGDCKDKATLFVALLRAIGEDAYPVLVFYGDPSAVLPDWPSPSFNHMVVCLPAGNDVPSGWPVVDGGAIGRVVVFDPTSESTPLGMLPDGEQGGHGLIVDPRTSQLIDLPPGADSLDCRVDARIDSVGDLKASVVETKTGTIGSDENDTCESGGKERFAQSIERTLHRAVPFLAGLRLSTHWTPERGEFEERFDFDAAGYGRRAGDLVLIDPRLIPTNRQLGAWKTRRDGFVWSMGGRYHEIVRITLPPKCEILELPEAWQGEGPQVKGGVSYRREGDEVVFECDVTHVPAFLDHKNYELSREFVQKLTIAGRRPIVIRIPHAE